MTFYLIVGGIVIFLVAFVWGRSTKKLGLMSTSGADLPYSLFTVMYSNRQCTVLRDRLNGKCWLVSTQVFAGKPIRPKDIVRRVRDTDEMKKLEISVPQPFDVFVKDGSE